MAKLSNINGKFAVEDTGAIRFSDQTGTTGQILKSNGNSAPTWVDPNTVGTGPWLPLAGGVVSGSTTFQSSLTVGGTLTVNGSGGSVFNSTGASNHIIAAYRASNGNNVATFRTTDSGYIFRIHAQNAGTIYVQNDDGSNYIKIPDSGSNEVSGNTTFTGTVDAKGFRTTSGSTDYSLLTRNSANTAVYIQQAGSGNIVDFRYGSQAAGQGTSAMIIDDSGKVGIGTGLPNYKLEVESTSDADLVSIKSTATANNTQMRLGISGNDSVISGTGGSVGNLVFKTYGSERIRVDSAGRVTFGPDAQDIQIDPASTNSGNNLIYMRGNASDDKSSLQMNHFGYADYYIGVGHVGNGKFNIANDLTGNDFVIDTSGNVGIGTDSPNYQLEVRTTTNNRAIQAVNSTTSGTNWGFQGGAFGVGASKNIGLQINVEGASTNYAALLIGGNVGIETATPQKKLHIEGTGGASEMQILVSSASDTVGHTAGIGLRGEGGEADGDLRIKGGIFFERISGSFGNGKMILAVNSSVNNNSVTVADHALTIDTNKNVGIGTASPTGYRLVVENTSEDLLKLHNSTDGLDALISFTNPGGTLGRIQGIDNGGLGFDTGNNAGGINTNAMFIKNDGNVGIGTTSPQAKLDIGDGDFKQLKIIGANRLCVFRFQNAQSSFNNPDIVLFSNTTATGSYPQVSVHIKMHGRGFSANYSQFTEALATVELSTALIGLRSSIINHTTLGSAVSAGTFSISGTSLRFTPNRQTNYDTFSIEVNINSISVTYNT